MDRTAYPEPPRLLRSQDPSSLPDYLRELKNSKLVTLSYIPASKKKARKHIESGVSHDIPISILSKKTGPATAQTFECVLWQSDTETGLQQPVPQSRPGTHEHRANRPRLGLPLHQDRSGAPELRFFLQLSPPKKEGVEKYAQK
ncbi:hypothetical protein KL930_001812 [Ogataea haglerorum]|uniref:Uncharacterized protein n=1 Tax=Ogataea haglerorum TaxID=1937702 RepID=A0AAN6D8P7_9ASCO|nr:uncharacterized protein KL911_001753 [Ogataea haglerorum]KAG7698150.1 hypothetical protein KL915_001867 [Ogataea haglerorum]KAG7699556.1 hypothetical protein KL951_001273 [Ogataea haglerorum]KAG7708371.1 hypothetical protein KL914_002097 [Ogataea haglerorum]KAG7721222.1 hypothetical protein KL913_000958 [Ogataea haglerorum]KAG7721976.1 hypothetical protein KL949_000954 [Ogataea haglerorum]